MHRISLPALASKAALVTVSLALAACGGNGDDAAPTTTAATAASTIQAGMLDPGTYEGTPFEPAVRLTIAEQGWRALFTAEDDQIALEHQDGRFLALTHVTRVVDPQTNRDVPAPKDLVAWLREHPALQPTETSAVSVAGVNGTRIDAAPTKRETDLFWYTGGAMHADPDVRWSVIVVDAGGGTLLTIVIGAPKASLDEALTKAQPLLESIEFA